ncbi:MAG TPA: alpha/beta fold hydrolase [Gammaproteobacteria bacterium]|nr:alpha/beta fold hydrolase [Gammaproteobacteria bacterium]
MLVTYSPIIIPGPAGQLEALISAPDTQESTAVGIICHPHPLYGGAMNNKVVTTIARTFHELGLHTVRFNFRGVGKSEGSYAEGIGETEDLRAVSAWARKNYPNQPIWLAGFSFGSYVAMRIAAAEEVAQLITIAPAVNHVNFGDADQVRCPWLLIMGEADEIVPVADVKAWVKKLSVPVRCVFLPGVSHFFHGHLGLLSEELKRNLPKRN